jgi:uncharacterized Rmd1/YagE family protein
VYPRIYNLVSDLTLSLSLNLMNSAVFKSRSHLLKLSVSHAFAQSTLLSYYESLTTRVFSSPPIQAIPTGKLFKLRRDVNLVSNVLDTPELFWSEASLKGLYDAVKEYMEIEGRVKVLNEKIGIASDLVG